MRLNGRGLANIWEHEENKGLDIDCYEFQPSDFDEGIVMLTVEEAKLLIRILNIKNFHCSLNLTEDEFIVFDQIEAKFKRIEQSEGKQ